jgi:phage repressor protein C with HTH and peptisase S24 domain
MLGGMGGEDPSFGTLVPVARADLAPPATGPDDGNQIAKPCFAFDPGQVRLWTSADASQLAIIRVEGDAMSPTLNPGDDVLVDLSDSADRLRDGLYALKIDDIMLVKRLAVHPVGRRVTVQSDNPVYCDLPDCAPEEIPCLGRVIWAGRRLV